MIHNKILYSNLKKLTESALDLYTQNFPFEQFTDDDFNNFYILSKLDIVIKNKTEFIECMNLMNKDDQIHDLLGQLVGTSSGMTIVGDAESCILSFLHQMYINNQKIESFDDIYSKFEDLFYSTELDFIDSCSLYNFDYNNVLINLDDSTTIKRIIPTSNIPHAGMGGYDDFSKSQFIIERSYKMQKIVKSSTTSDAILQNKNEIKKDLYASSEIFDQVVNSIRISKSSGIYRGHKIKSKMTTFHPHSGSIIRSPFFENTVIGVKCSLVESDIENIVKIFNFINSNRSGIFSVAARRLSIGMERRRIEDKLIDYMVGFESLYLPKSHDELTFKLSMRIAFITEISNENRQHIYSFIKDMYNSRSNIVHGTATEIKDESIVELERILRNSLAIYMADKSKFSKENLNNIFFK